MKTFLRKSAFLTIVFFVANLVFASVAFGQATVTTDKDDYAPGEYVIISGTGWTAGERVDFHFDETPKPVTCLNSHNLYAIADSDGNIYNNLFLIKENHLGVAFVLTATGQTSGSIATRNFTDANITVVASGLPAGASLKVSYRLGTSGNVPSGSYLATETFTPPISPLTFVQNNNQYIDFIFPTVVFGGTTYESKTINANGTIVTGPTLRYLMPNASAKTFTGIYVATCTVPAITINPLGTTKIVGESVTFSINATGTSILSYQWRKDGVNIFGATSSSYSIPSLFTADAGDYDIVITNSCGSATSNPATLMVNKATPVITWTNPADITYGVALSGVQLNASASVAGTFNYTPEATILLNAGDSHILSVNFTPTDGINYNDVTKTVNINIKKASLLITAENKTKAYGAELPTLTVSYTGLVNDDLAPFTVPTISTTATPSSSFGTYPITASGAIDANYDITYAAGTLSVTAVPLLITAENKTKAYGAELPTLTVSYTGLVNDDLAPFTVPTISTTATASSFFGTYPITALGAIDANYDITYAAGTLSVTAVPLLITTENKTKAYGAELPTLTVSYTGLVNDDLAPFTVPTISTTATAS
ncbi:MBG domain-containing protein, partial [Flavobacterium sp.]|uniref:MBG domain-containing protein n=1 Tax=Flavobacterium sp. TaxID=239 RepID=UPI001B443465